MAFGSPSLGLSPDENKALHNIEAALERLLPLVERIVVSIEDGITITVETEVESGGNR